MPELRLRDDQIAAVARVVGVAVMVAGFAVALDGLDRTPSSFTGGHV